MVENEFGCKDEKVKDYEYEHCPQQFLKIVQQFLQICLSSYKSPKKVRKFCNFEKPKLRKLNHFITFIRKKGDMLVNFSLLAYIMGMTLIRLQEKKISTVISVRKEGQSYFHSFFV